MVVPAYWDMIERREEAGSVQMKGVEEEMRVVREGLVVARTFVAWRAARSA